MFIINFFSFFDTLHVSLPHHNVVTIELYHVLEESDTVRSGTQWSYTFFFNLYLSRIDVIQKSTTVMS